MPARKFADYNAALLMAYEEEVSGEAYFVELGEIHGGAARAPLTLMAEMERATAEAIRPMLAAAGVEPRQRAALLAEGRAQAQEIRGKTWPSLLRDMRDTYGDYVAEFEAIQMAAPPRYRDRADLLVAHEVAIIDFARAELAGEEDSFRYLRAYLSDARLLKPTSACPRHRRPCPTYKAK